MPVVAQEQAPTLQITVHQADGLEEPGDCQAVITYNGRVVRSNIQRDTTSPHWNQKFDFPLSGTEVFVKIIIRDSSAWRDVGQTFINLTQVKMRRPTWYTLNSADGDSTGCRLQLSAGLPEGSFGRNETDIATQPVRNDPKPGTEMKRNRSDDVNEGSESGSPSGGGRNGRGKMPVSKSTSRGQMSGSEGQKDVCSWDSDEASDERRRPKNNMRTSQKGIGESTSGRNPAQIGVKDSARNGFGAKGSPSPVPKGAPPSPAPKGSPKMAAAADPKGSGRGLGGSRGGGGGGRGGGGAGRGIKPDPPQEDSDVDAEELFARLERYKDPGSPPSKTANKTPYASLVPGPGKGKINITKSQASELTLSTASLRGSTIRRNGEVVGGLNPKPQATHRSSTSMGVVTPSAGCFLVEVAMGSHVATRKSLVAVRALYGQSDYALQELQTDPLPGPSPHWGTALEFEYERGASTLTLIVEDLAPGAKEVVLGTAIQTIKTGDTHTVLSLIDARGRNTGGRLTVRLVVPSKLGVPSTSAAAEEDEQAPDELTLDVTVLRGSRISSEKVNSFAVVQYGNAQRKTQRAKATFDPRWNETLQFPHQDGVEELTLMVQNKDRVQGDRVLGKCVVNIKDALKASTMWYTLIGEYGTTTGGKVQLQINTKAPPPPTPRDVKFTVHQGSRLFERARGRPDPELFVVIDYGHDHQHTRPAKGGQPDPDWGDDLIFRYDSSLATAELQLRDRKLDDAIVARADIAMDQLPVDKKWMSLVDRIRRPLQAKVQISVAMVDLETPKLLRKGGLGKEEYEGTVGHQQKRHGKGRAAVAEVYEYEGEWHDNKRHGQGKYTLSDGTVYEGTFDKGRKSGYGIQTWPDGRRYEGEWLNGLQHGKGNLWDKGVQFEGVWERGQVKHLRKLGLAPESPGAVFHKYSKGPEEMIGTLAVTVIAAKGLLPMGDDEPDAYCVLKCGSFVERTETRRNTRSPAWHAEFLFHLAGAKEHGSLHITLKEWELIGSDKVVGELDLNLTHLPRDGTAEEQWHPIPGTKEGQLQLKLAFLSKEDSDEQHMQAVLGKSGHLSDMELAALAQKAGIVRVMVAEGRDLMKKGIGRPDPFCVVKLGDEEVRTQHRKNETTPHWMETFEFAVDGLTVENKLWVLLNDYERVGEDDVIGDFVVDLTALRLDGAVNDEWYRVVGVPKGEIRLCISFLPPGEDLAAKKAILADTPGVLRVLVSEGRELTKKSIGRPDPYCIVRLEDREFKTQWKKNEIAPQWQETFDFPVTGLTSDAPLVVVVQDWERVGDGPVLGDIEIDPTRLKTDGSVNDKWYTVRGASRGEVRLCISFLPPPDPEDSPPEHLPPGKIVVQVLGGRGITKSMGRPDPYLTLEFCSITAKTSTINNTSDPVWNQTFEFGIRKPPYQDPNLRIGVVDYERLSKDNSLGQLELDLRALRIDRAPSDAWHTASGTGGQIHLLITLVPDPTAPPPAATPEPAARRREEMASKGRNAGDFASKGRGKGEASASEKPRERYAGDVAASRGRKSGRDDDSDDDKDDARKGRNAANLAAKGRKGDASASDKPAERPWRDLGSDDEKEDARKGRNAANLAAKGRKGDASGSDKPPERPWRDLGSDDEKEDARKLARNSSRTIRPAAARPTRESGRDESASAPGRRAIGSDSDDDVRSSRSGPKPVPKRQESRAIMKTRESSRNLTRLDGANSKSRIAKKGSDSSDDNF